MKSSRVGAQMWFTLDWLRWSLYDAGRFDRASRIVWRDDSAVLSPMRLRMPLPAVFWAGHAILMGNLNPALFLQPALPYPNTLQLHHKWCWAAVAQGVKAYYSGKLFPPFYPDQCDIATRTLVTDGMIPANITCCDPNLAAQHCHIEYRLEAALEAVGHRSQDPRTILSVQRERRFWPPWLLGLLDGEIRNGRVLGILVLLGGGASLGHFVVVHGYQIDSISRDEYLDVADPDIPQLTRNLITLWTLANAYRVIGTWDHVYLTQP